MLETSEKSTLRMPAGTGKIHFGLLLACMVICSTGMSWAAMPPDYVDASTYGGGWNPTDATNALQAAIDSGKNVYIPKMASDWIIKPVTLSNSNQNILFESGVVVSAKKGEFLGLHDSLFTASGVSHVTISGYGATLKMNKADYTKPPYPTAQWRMGIQVLSVSHFHIEGLTIRDTGGDGIYLGDLADTYNSDVTIKDVRLDNNYRNGISVISVNGLVIDNAVVTNTDGTLPRSGIDMEPNYGNQKLLNIIIKNSIFNTNGRNGLMISPENMNNPAADISVQIDNVTAYGNGKDGYLGTQQVPGVTITDSLFVSNDGYGLEIENGPVQQSVQHSAIYDNGSWFSGGATRNIALGPGTLTNVQPQFYSTNPNSPYYMYLDPSISTLISQGASNGGYMGARPVYGVPEPAGGAFLLIAGGLLMRRRKLPGHAFNISFDDLTPIRANRSKEPS